LAVRIESSELVLVLSGDIIAFERRRRPADTIATA
jgi:hypothetical protein